MQKQFDFANILFAGPCNLRCPYCIGKQIDPQLNRNNLNDFPLPNLDRFVGLLKQHQVSEITFTGTTTDPQLYRHEVRLLAWLRARLPAARYALHTNGQLVLKKLDVFNRYDRACISFPSFRPGTYKKMMGSDRVPDLAEIVRRARIPVKVSAVINEHNANEIDEILTRCVRVGVKRLVIRRLYGDPRTWDILGHLSQAGSYRNNPIYHYRGLQVTVWDFRQTSSTSLNLFSNGTISDQYLLTRAVRQEISSE